MAQAPAAVAACGSRPINHAQPLTGTLDRLTEAGIELLDREPRPGAEGTKIAFLAPKSTFRMLMELCEKT
jgi:hypothetical protein